MELLEEIQRLIALETEGDYWDFKEMWHNNKASLLHDIICMANNQVGRDAYIIFGVSDSKSQDGVKVKGVQQAGRKDQQHLIDFLRDKKFAGGVRPPVYLAHLRRQQAPARLPHRRRQPRILHQDLRVYGKIPQRHLRRTARKNLQLQQFHTLNLIRHKAPPDRAALFLLFFKFIAENA